MHTYTHTLRIMARLFCTSQCRSDMSPSSLPILSINQQFISPWMNDTAYLFYASCQGAEWWVRYQENVTPAYICIAFLPSKSRESVSYLACGNTLIIKYLKWNCRGNKNQNHSYEWTNAFKDSFKRWQFTARRLQANTKASSYKWTVGGNFW